MKDTLLQSLLNTIAQQISSCAPVEKNNIQRDLQLISSAINSGEYLSTEMLNRNRFDTQKRTYEFFTYIEGYYNQAKQWQTILQQIITENTQTVLDIGPGFSPKIELALQRLDFKGKVSVLDKSSAALSGLKKFLALMSIPFDLDVICEDLYAVQQRSFDLVAANHLFDDLLLDGFCSDHNRPIVDIYENEANLVSITNDIICNFDFENLSQKLSQSFPRLVSEGGHLLFRHYQGITEMALNLESWFEFTTSFFEKVIHNLTRDEFQLVERKNNFIVLSKNTKTR